jgi:hypothetical protein
MLQTTTWIRRSNDTLNYIVDNAVSMGIKSPTVIEYGPGGRVSFMAELFDYRLRHASSEDDSSVRGIVHTLESAVRKTGLFSLTTWESREIADVLYPLAPREMHVIDKEQKVIDAAKKSMNGVLSIAVRYHLLDIEKDPVPLEADLVFAYNVIERTRNRKRAFETIASSVKFNGLLSTTYSPVSDSFSLIAPGLFRRIGR